MSIIMAIASQKNPASLRAHNDPKLTTFHLDIDLLVHSLLFFRSAPMKRDRLFRRVREPSPYCWEFNAALLAGDGNPVLCE